MNPIHAKINRVNGHLLGTCAFFDADLVRGICAQDMDQVTFSVTAEPRKIILNIVEEK
jgi:hypothetical protein